MIPSPTAVSAAAAVKDFSYHKIINYTTKSIIPQPKTETDAKPASRTLLKMKQMTELKQLSNEEDQELEAKQQSEANITSTTPKSRN